MVIAPDDTVLSSSTKPSRNTLTVLASKWDKLDTDVEPGKDWSGELAPEKYCKLQSVVLWLSNNSR